MSKKQRASDINGVKQTTEFKEKTIEFHKKDSRAIKNMGKFSDKTRVEPATGQDRGVIRDHNQQQKSPYSN